MSYCMMLHAALVSTGMGIQTAKPRNRWTVMCICPQESNRVRDGPKMASKFGAFLSFNYIPRYSSR